MELAPRAALAFMVTAAALAAAAAPGHAAWTDAVKVTGERGVDPRVVVGAGGEAFVVWGHRGPELGAGGLPVAYSTRPPAGSFTGPQPLAANAGIISSVASNTRGDLTVSWFAPTETGGSLLHTISRPVGGQWGTLANPPFRSDVAAMDGSGNTTFVWTENDRRPEAERGDDRVMAATRFADGSIGPAREVAVQDHATAPSAGADGGGRVVVAWLGRNEGEPDDQWRVNVAEAGPGGAFGARRALSEPFELGLGYPRVAMNDRGDTAVAWGRTEPGPAGWSSFIATPEVAYRRAGDDFGAPEQVPTTDASERALLGFNAAISPRGDVLLAWAPLSGATFAYRPAGGPIEPALSIPKPGQLLLNYEPRVSFDGKDTAVAVWVRQLDYHDHRLVSMTRPRGKTEWGRVREIVAARHLFTPRLDFDGAGRGVAVWAHEERTASGSGRTEHGIGAAFFDPTLPDIDRVKLSRKRAGASVVVDLTKTSGLTITLQRLAGKRYKSLGTLRARAKGGRNRIALTRVLAERVAVPGDYRVVVSARKRDGTVSAPVRLAFRVQRGARS